MKRQFAFCWTLFLTLGFLAMTPAFGQDQDATQKAFKLKAEGAFQEMRGEREAALKSYQESLKYVKDAAIEKRVTALGGTVPTQVERTPVQKTVPGTTPAPSGTRVERAPVINTVSGTALPPSAGRDSQAASASASKSMRVDMFRLPELPAVEAALPPPIELDRLDQAQWAGCVSAAREAMRLVYGQMSPDEETRFEKRWKAALEFPNKAVVAYFNKLNPLLAQFLALRRASAQTLLAMDHAQYEAATLVAYKDTAGFAEQMRSMALLRTHLGSIEKGVEAVAGEIEALGEMPDAAAAQTAARKRHQVAMAMFAGGAGLQGEWVGTSKRIEIKGDLDLSDNVANTLLSDSVMEAIKKSAEEKMPQAEREAKKIEEKLKQEAWTSGKPIPPEMAGKFSEHVIFTRVETESGDEVYHLYNFKPIKFDREDYEKRGQLTQYERSRAACANWLGSRNFIWPVFDEGMNFWKLEHESRNPWDWRENWTWEFDVEGNALTITEQGWYADDRTHLGRGEIAGKMRQHRVWELRRVGRDPKTARPADWSVEGAVHAIQHPSSAWVLKGVKVKPPESPLPEGSSVDVAKDALSVTVTCCEKKWIPKASPASSKMSTADSEDWDPGTYRLIPFVSRHRLAKAPPEKLRPGDSFNLDASVAIVPPKEEGFGFFRASTTISDWFTRDGMLGTTKTIEADQEKGKLSVSEHHQCPSVPDWPYEAGAKAVIGFAGNSRLSFDIEFTYESVSMEKVDQVDAAIKVSGAGKKSGTTPGLDPAQVAQVKFHEVNIEYFKAQVERTEADIRGTADATARDELERRLLYSKDAMQRELDQIHCIKTGVYIHTRTEADDFNRKLMAEQSRVMAEHFGPLHRIIERMPRVIASAPPEERDALRKRFFEVVNSKSIASGDLGDIRAVADEIGQRIGDIRQKELDKAENDLWWEEAKVTGLEATKKAADIGLMVTASIAFAPAMAIGATSAEIAAAAQGLTLFTGYAAFTTGYMEGNPAGAVRQVLTGITLSGALADQVFQGYQEGVVNAYEQYAQDVMKANMPGSKSPGKVGPVDEVSAGLSSASWEAGKTLAMMGAMKMGIYWLCGAPPSRPVFKIEGGRSAKNFKGTTQMAGWMSIEEFTRLEAFRHAQMIGRQRVEHFQAISDQYWTLHNRLRGAGAGLRDLQGNPELRILQRRMTEAHGRVKADYHAKMNLNQSGNTTTLSHYNRIDTMQMRKVRERVGELMDAQGCSQQEYKLFSNSASSGKAGIDIDLGMVEPRDNPVEFAKWLRTLTRTENGVTQRLTLDEFRQLGQRNLRIAFREVMGEEMDEPFLLFTHSQHPEAYHSLEWLGTSKIKHVVVDGIKPGWTQQAASVSRFKIDELRGLPGMDEYTQLQESCRGLVKDFDTKLAPLLKRSTNADSVAHMSELYDLMQRFSRNEIGPVEADRQIRLLTGGQGIADIAERFRVMLEGLGGWMSR